MKPVVRYIIAASAVTACLFLWLVGDRVGAENRREVTCNSVDAIIADSLAFISPDDIKDWMADYGTYLGLRLDSVDLRKVEAVIDGKSAVRKSQAWLTDDGVLHVSVTQRAPVVRFQGDAGGFYADAEGFLFPLQLRHTARVPVVDGALPLKIDKNFKGEPATEKERQWVHSMIDSSAGWAPARNGTTWWDRSPSGRTGTWSWCRARAPSASSSAHPQTSTPSSAASASTTKASPRPGRRRTRRWTCVLTARSSAETNNYTIWKNVTLRQLTWERRNSGSV